MPLTPDNLYQFLYKCSIQRINDSNMIHVFLQLHPAQLWRVLYRQCADISRVPWNYIRGAGTVRLDSFYPVQETTD